MCTHITVRRQVEYHPFTSMTNVNFVFAGMSGVTGAALRETSFINKRYVRRREGKRTDKGGGGVENCGGGGGEKEGKTVTKCFVFIVCLFVAA